MWRRSNVKNEQMKVVKWLLATISIVSAVIAMGAETVWHINETIHYDMQYETKYILEIAYSIILIPMVFAIVLLVKQRHK